MGAIKFGASISASGRYALQGRQAVAGPRSWAEAINAEGGVAISALGKAVPVTLIHYDDGSFAARVVPNVERLICVDRVDILLGPYGSDLTLAAAPIARQYGKVMWNHGGASDEICSPAGRLVAILTPVSRYFAGLVDLVSSIDPGPGQAVFLYRRGSGFGRLAARSVEASCRKAGLTLSVLTYSSSRNDLPPLLRNLRRQRPDLILGAGAFEDDCALARNLMANGVKAKAFGFVSAAMQKFKEALGPQAEGFMGPSQWEPAAGYAPDFGPSPAEAAGRIEAMGVPADYPAAQAYAACLLAQRCLEQVGSADDQALWRAACALDCTTFFGRFKIDEETGLQVGHEMVWVQWQDGRKVIVWPQPLAQAAPVYPRR